MSNLPQKSQFLIYQAPGGAIKIDVRFEDETVWLAQQHLADLFQTTKQNIGQHLKNIFEEGELAQDSVVKNFFTTAADGKNYSTNFYNLDAIWIAKLDGFLRLNERGILTHAGNVSHELALSHAEQEYDSFHRQRLIADASRPDDFEKCLKQLPPAKPCRKKKGGAK